MGKRVFIAEKPSVARQFADALELSFNRRDGYLESGDTLVTWCVGHLVSMSYPDAYDEKYKKWSLATIPFLPDKYLYQVIPDARKQYEIVRSLLTSADVDKIYICTDSGREGEYIYRLVAMQAGVCGKQQLRVWIDSQTKDEILRGIREARPDEEYDSVGAAAYLRAKEDYLMGINFSRALTLKYGRSLEAFLGNGRCVIAVGRVMTCVLGMIVQRERDIRSFVKTPFYRVTGSFTGQKGESPFTAEWHATEKSVYFSSPKLYKENGFRKREDAEELIRKLRELCAAGNRITVSSVNRKKETKNAPLLYNLAELQFDCSKFLKLSPDQALDCAQELYEKKLTTYPRTDARVLSSAVAKEITKNLNGLYQNPMYRDIVREIADMGTASRIGKTKYTDDKAITDHYAIIPTGDGTGALNSVSENSRKVYEMICRRFLAVFYPPAVFDKIALSVVIPDGEHSEEFTCSLRTRKEDGYLKISRFSFLRGDPAPDSGGSEDNSEKNDPSLVRLFSALRKGSTLLLNDLNIREGETKPPVRYNSGAMILAMENAGQLIEDEELRETIKGSGIGTSATRAGILEKLVKNRYIALNRKTQIYTPTQLGEMIFDTVSCSLKPLLDPKLTASWEKGLTGVADGSVSEQEYMSKLENYVTRRTNMVKESDYREALAEQFRYVSGFYADAGHKASRSGKNSRSAEKHEATGKSASSKSASSQKSS